jgi:hypothetical protein
MFVTVIFIFASISLCLYDLGTRDCKPSVYCNVRLVQVLEILSLRELEKIRVTVRINKSLTHLQRRYIH